MRKPHLCICENKDADQLQKSPRLGTVENSCYARYSLLWPVTAQLISAFVFAIRIVQSLYCLNPKFQASNHLLCLYSTVCVEPGRNPGRPVFSQQGLMSFFAFMKNTFWTAFLSFVNCCGKDMS